MTSNIWVLGYVLCFLWIAYFPTLSYLYLMPVFFLTYTAWLYWVGAMAKSRGYSGAWALIGVLPLIAVIVVLVKMVWPKNRITPSVPMS